MIVLCGTMRETKKHKYFRVSLAFTNLPIMNQLFHTAAIILTEWPHTIAVGLVFYVVVACNKRIRLLLE